MDSLIEPAIQGPAPAPSMGEIGKLRSATPIIVAVIALFALPGGLLWLIGYNYNGMTGSPLTKIHPSTYIIVAIYAWNALTSGNPVGYVARGFWKRPACLLLLVGMIALFVQTVSRSSPGMAGSIDTFLGPVLLVIAMADLDDDGKRRIEIVLHVLMTINAVMALGEFVTNVRVFQFVVDGVPNVNDARSTALQGHPLEDAAITAIYVLAVISSKGSLSAPMKLALVSLQFAALIAFGGRTGTVLSLALGGIYLANRAHLALRAGRVPILTAATVAILAATLPIGIVALAERGFFDAIMERFFVDDGGSAASRVEMFRIFEEVSNRDLLVGPDPTLIASERWLHGLADRKSDTDAPVVSGHILDRAHDDRRHGVSLRSGQAMLRECLVANDRFRGLAEFLREHRVQNQHRYKIRRGDAVPLPAQAKPDQIGTAEGMGEATLPGSDYFTVSVI